ncbi:glutamyl-tRNA(Gln) amidotransferase subunit E [Candidatus Micrarchaeota archaeon CG1_02_47_40]|nr:MAG: glutamyl-tRNA(Gln) amidotransferase subunit E [Candidatus Micrarchaeota archaeon CG1_02_47_40]
MKCGIEIHQRLDTGKLFCSCPSTLSESTPARIIERKQHPVSSETGGVDTAVLFEAQKDRTFTYLVPPESACLVECDCEPPHKMNEEALFASLSICTQLGSTPMDEIQIMRKTIIDGSNTSGFQRTALIAIGGSLETSRGKVGIQTVCIEEESAGIVRRSGENTVFRLDRLGMPLIEIATEPVIEGGEHAKETARKIGEMLRIAGCAQRGIGTIRQDLNISVEGGARVEIKGAQELEGIPALVENEAQRQKKLLGIMKEVAKRMGDNPEIPAHFPDVTSVFKETGSLLLKKALQKGERVFGLRLPKHAGLLGIELYAGRRYGSELSDYAKSAGVGGIIHSDEDMVKYGITQAEISVLRTRLGMESTDAFVLAAGEERIARKALLAVWSRALESEIPSETRRALPDGASEYMRPIAGGSRMYPETDVPPIRIGQAELERVKNEVGGRNAEEVKNRINSLLNPELAVQILKSRHLNLFLRLCDEGHDAKLIAITLTKTLTELRREGVELRDANSSLIDLFFLYSEGIFVKGAIPHLLRKMAEGKGCEDAVKELGLLRITGEGLKRIVEEEEGSMAGIMKKYSLLIDADELKEFLRGYKAD